MMRQGYDSPKNFEFQINSFILNQLIPSGRSWMPQDRRIQFINLPEDCTIKIYTTSGDFVAEIIHNNPTRGYEDWNLTSYVDQAIASGVYMFSVEDNKTGDVQIGKFVVIK